MFGFSLAAQLFQGSAKRTWNCVTQFTNLLWYKLNYLKEDTMPRSRRRHHSRSRSRSRSHSHERDREVKRRKIESVESPTHKRSVSDSKTPEDHNIEENNEEHITDVKNNSTSSKIEEQTSTVEGQELEEKVLSNKQSDEKVEDKKEENIETIEINDDDEDEIPSEKLNQSINDKVENIKDETKVTPKKASSPKLLQKKLESEKKKQQKQQEREQREKEKQERLKQKQLKEEQKKKEREEKEKERQLKEEQKKKEREEKEKEKQLKEEQKKKEREEKEQKRKEKEEKEEQRRKEKEQEKLKKQQEIDEKNKEKQKSAALLMSFIKKSDLAEEKKTLLQTNSSSTFMPFEIKSDMRLPSERRPKLNDKEKENLINYLTNPEEKVNYLNEIKCGKKIIGKSIKTWPYEEDANNDITKAKDDDDDDNDEFGETICEEDKTKMKIRVKYLSFHDNRRPAYYGTFRKKSKFIKARRPFGKDKQLFDYDYDSDDDWEDEEQGESLKGSDDEEKEDGGIEEDDYEIDNEFFVPHGHLSDDEIDDEANNKLSPESHKAKLKLLKAEFDEDMQHKTHKLKARSIGCIWYNKDGKNVDECIDKYLKPLSMITNGQIIIKKRCNLPINIQKLKIYKELDAELIPKFLKIIHFNTNNQKNIISEFLDYLMNNGWSISKASLYRFLKANAQWKKCSEDGPMFNKFCWCVNDDMKDKFNV